MRVSRGSVLFVGITLAVPLYATSAASARPHAALSVPSYGSTWLADAGTNQLVEYAPNASGSAAPVATISGAGTGLAGPTGVGVDARGDVFAANATASTITEYAPGASGDATPIATIGGSKTGLDTPSSLTVSGTNVWVTDPADNLVEAFSAGSSGNILPAMTLSGATTKLDHPVQVSSVGSFNEIWVLNTPSTGAPSLDLYVGEGGDARPVSRIAGARTDLTGADAIQANVDDRVDVAIGATNTVAEFSVDFGGGNRRPELTLHGAATGLDQPDGLAIDAAGRLSVLSAGDHSVRTYAFRARGNTAPIRSLTGLAATASAATIIAGGPGPVTHVRVSVFNHGAHIRWHRPRLTGGGVLRYYVTAFPERPGVNLVVFALDGGTRATHKTLHHLRDGVRYDFEVEVQNLFGFNENLGFAAGTPYGRPGAPRAVATAPGSQHGSVDVVWTRPADNGGKPISGYRVEVSNGRFTRHSAYRSIAVGPKRRHVVVHGVADRHHTFIRVLARNAIGLGTPSKIVR